VTDRLGAFVREQLVELVPELLVTLFFGVGATVLSAVGVVLERIGAETLAAGDPVGLWILFMGAMAFYFGPFAMGYHDFLPRLRALLARRE
jgi:hypothetical protein